MTCTRRAQIPYNGAAEAAQLLPSCGWWAHCLTSCRVSFLTIQGGHMTSQSPWDTLF